MYYYFIFLIFLQFIRAQYYSKYPTYEEENYEDFHNYYPRKFQRNVEYSSSENENNEEDDPSLSLFDSSLVEDVQTRITNMKNSLNEDFKKVSTLDAKNHEVEKKTITEIQDEINYRVRYVEQLLYKKREGDSSTNANVIRCVSDSLSKLSNITPDLMRDAERCINQELDNCRAHTKITLDMLKEHLQKVKHHQERLNECSSLIKLRNPCLVKLVQEISGFKKNVNTTLLAKMTETTNILSGLTAKLRKCAAITISKVVTYASDVVVKFNSCMKGAAIDEEKKQLEEMMLFIV